MEQVQRRRGRPPKQFVAGLDGEVPDDDFVTHGREVQRVQFHAGVQIEQKVRYSLDASVDQMVMHMCEHGVHVVTPSQLEYIVGMGDILWVRLK